MIDPRRCRRPRAARPSPLPPAASLSSPLLLAASLCCAATPAGRVTARAHAAPAAAVRSAPPARVAVDQPARRGEAARLVGEGVAAVERGDRQAARTLFERALKIDPANADAHTYLGALADGEGDAVAAERHFAAAARAAPASAAARSNHGAALMRLGRTDDAAREFAAALRSDPRHAGALFNLAQIRFNAGTNESAREAYELLARAHAAAPDAEIARSLVVAALRLEERAAAPGHYRDYAAAVSRASASPSHAAASPVAAAPSRAELAAALLENGFAAEAAEESSAALAAEPRNVEYLLLAARSHLARKDVAAAGRALEGAVASGVEDGRVYAALAEVYEAAGRVENAIPAMRLAIERDPKSEAYRFRYAMLLTDTKAPAAAVIRLNEALELFPRSSRLWFAHGVAQTALNKIEEAAQSFARSAELDEKFAPALAYLGMTHDQQGRYAEAINFYERALALDPRLAAAHYLAAEALLKQGGADEARAERHLRDAVALDPRFAPARLSLAKLHLRANRAAEAVAELERVVAEDPDLADAHYQLGRALQRLRREQEARAAFAVFKRLSEERRERERTEPKDIMRRLANVRF